MDNKYVKIKRLGKRENTDIMNGTVEETEKMDGCFMASQRVRTSEGLLNIGDIVKNKMDVQVLSMNENGIKEYRPILKYYEYGPADNWVEIKYNQYGKMKIMTVTDNHNVFTNNSLKQVKDISTSDKLISERSEFTQLQRDIIFGSILGDGSLKNMQTSKSPMYAETHGIKQKPYLEWKEQLLGDLIIWNGEYKSRYSDMHKYTTKYRIHSRCTPVLNEFDFMYCKGKKHIPHHTIPQYLTPLALAIWFMDDGATSHSSKQRSRATFHTQSLSEDDVCYLRSVLKEVYGIESNQHNYKGWQIDLTTDGSAILFDVIAPYVIENMEYKLPDEHKGGYIEIEQKQQQYLCDIVSIKPIPHPRAKRYDLEIKDNHNYFVNGVLVHNSNFSFFVGESDELVFRSHNRVIPIGDYGDKAWKRCIEYIQGIHASKEAGLPFDEWFIYFGECMTPHTLNYGIMSPFIGYAVYDPRNSTYYGNWEYHFKSRDIPTPETIIHTDTELLTDEYIESRMKLPSQFGTSGVVREGIVLKNYSNQQFAKFVNEDFQEQNRAVFGVGDEKHSDTWKIVEKYCTPARIDKSIFTIRDEQGLSIGMEMMMRLPAMVQFDILKEEIGNIYRKYKYINFKEYKKLIGPKCVEQLKHRIKAEMM